MLYSIELRSHKPVWGGKNNPKKLSGKINIPLFHLYQQIKPNI
jgi:hypothetical protein